MFRGGRDGERGIYHVTYLMMHVKYLLPPLPEQNFVGGRQQENIPPTCVDRTSFCSHQVPALVMPGRGLK